MKAFGKPLRADQAMRYFGGSRAGCVALSFITLASGDDSFLLELTEANFDVLLRETPVALVAYVNQNTALHYPSLMPTLRELANAYEHAGIGVGTISDQYRELIERFGIDAFPTLHWMDGSKKWPYYASEATPVRHEGPRSFEALAGFIEAKTGIPPRVAEPGSQQEQQAAEPEAPSIGRADVLTAVDEHDCATLSAAYRACLRQKDARWHRKLCGDQRHEYLMCMSGSWAVHPDHHEELAGIYARQFAA